MPRDAGARRALWLPTLLHPCPLSCLAGVLVSSSPARPSHRRSSEEWSDSWKVLVYDRFCAEVISPLLSVKALRTKGAAPVRPCRPVTCCTMPALLVYPPVERQTLTPCGFGAAVRSRRRHAPLAYRRTAGPHRRRASRVLRAAHREQHFEDRPGSCPCAVLRPCSIAAHPASPVRWLGWWRQDCADNVYDETHVNFVSSLPRPLLELLARRVVETDSVRRVRGRATGTQRKQCTDSRWVDAAPTCHATRLARCTSST